MNHIESFGEFFSTEKPEVDITPAAEEESITEAVGPRVVVCTVHPEFRYLEMMKDTIKDALHIGMGGERFEVLDQPIKDEYGKDLIDIVVISPNDRDSTIQFLMWGMFNLIHPRLNAQE
jgi:hypothetical protein